MIAIDKKHIKKGHINRVYEDSASLLDIDKVYLKFKGQQINFPVKLLSQECIIS